mgnify:CR=1 FL=1
MILPKDIADNYAIQALFRGQANEAQQLRAVKCLIEEICGTYGMTFDPESARQSDFNEGKRHVGRVLVGIANISLGVVKAAEEKIEKRQQAKLIVKTRRNPNG